MIWFERLAIACEIVMSCYKVAPINPGTKMAKKKTTARRAWTSTDVRQMKSLAKKKIGAERIARTLKRTVGGHENEGVISWSFVGYTRVMPASVSFRKTPLLMRGFVFIGDGPD